MDDMVSDAVQKTGLGLLGMVGGALGMALAKMVLKYATFAAVPVGVFLTANKTRRRRRRRRRVVGALSGCGCIGR